MTDDAQSPDVESTTTDTGGDDVGVLGFKPDTISADALQATKPPAQPATSEPKPTWDEFAAKQNKLPTWNEYATQQARRSDLDVFTSTLVPHNPFSSEGQQELTDAQRLWAQRSPIWDTVKAAGFGAQEQFFGAVDEAKDTADEFHKSDIYKEMWPINKAIMDKFVIPAAADLYAGSAGAFGAVTGSLYGAGTSVGGEQFGRDIASIPESLMGETPLPHTVAVPKAAGVFEGEDVYLGTKEATKEQSQGMAVAQNQIDVAVQNIKPPAPYTLVTEAGRESPAAPANIHEMARSLKPELFTEYDRLSMVRDDLGQQLREQTKAKTEEAHTSPFTQDIADTQKRLEDANPRMTKIYQARLDDLLEKHETFLSENSEQVQQKLGADNPELARLRELYNKVDYRMRDLSPDVAQTYRDAEKQMPASPDSGGDIQKESVPDNIPDHISKQITQSGGSNIVEFTRPSGEKGFAFIHKGAGTSENNSGYNVSAYVLNADGTINRRIVWAEGGNLKTGGSGWARNEPGVNFKNFSSEREAKSALPSPKNAEQELQPTAPQKSIEEQKQNIINDFVQKAVAAGRPKEEAAAVAELEAARYETLSQAYPKYSAEEWYAREAADIKAGRETSKSVSELAQTTKGKLRRANANAKATITLFKAADASTLIHEKGHEWVEQILRLSKEEEAPAEMKADAEAIRKVAGTKADGSLTTKGHEKFARMFERWIMEGVAPSKQLAGVFAKLKSWMEAIYKTVDKLRAPINDDIRDLFDRMLSASPEKTVIAPESGAAKMMADIHETDAASTPHPDAGAAADAVRTEVKSASKKDQEANNAIENTETGSGTQAQGSAGDTQGAGGSENPPIGEVPPAQQPAEINESGTSPAPESSSMGGGKRGKREEGETRYVDKSGNIRLENLTEKEDVKDYMRQVAEDNNQFIEARGGVVTDNEVMGLAEAMGVDANELNIEKLKAMSLNDGVPLAARIMAGRKMLLASAEHATEAMMKAAETGDMKDIIALAEARDRHLMIAETIASTTAEWGRAGRAFRNISREEMTNAHLVTDLFQKSVGMTPEEMLEFAKSGKDIEAKGGNVRKFIKDSTKPTFGEMVVEYRINALCSGPVTHTRYVVGNAINAIWDPLVTTPIAATIGKARELLSGLEIQDRARIGEVGAQIWALGHGSVEGYRAAVLAWKEGKSAPLPGERITPNFKEAIPGKTGRAIRVPGYLINSIHSFFKTLRYEQNVSALAFRQAMKEGLEGENLNRRIAELTQSPTPEIMEFARIKDPAEEIAYKQAESEGLSGKELEVRAAELKDNPTPEMKEKLVRANISGQATVEALKQVYMAPTDYNTLSGRLQAAINQSPVAKCLIPFMKIGTQIEAQAILEGTPLGLVNKNIREGLLYKKGGAEGDIQWAKSAAITGLMGATSAMTAAGLMTGDGPTDPAQRNTWRLSHKPNTITIGDITIPYRGLGHLGMAMRFAANMTETTKFWDHKDGEKLAALYFESFSKSILEDNWMYGVQQMLDAVFHPEEKGKEFVENFATAWLPYSVGMAQVTHVIDPNLRQADSIFDVARSKIPGLSYALPEKRDMFGQPIIIGDVHNYDNDPVVQKMDQLRIGVGKLQPKIAGVKLTDEQFDEFSRLSGQFSKQYLNSMVTNPSFSVLSQAQQIANINKVISASRQQARAIVAAHYPEIGIQAYMSKKADAGRSQ